MSRILLYKKYQKRIAEGTAWLGHNFERISLNFLFVLFASYLALEVVGAIGRAEAPKTFEFANAALISLGALSALAFAYSSALPDEGKERGTAFIAGEQLLKSVISIIVAAGIEFILRLYINEPLFGITWAPFVALALLIVAEIALFTYAIAAAYPGIMSLWMLLRRKR